MTISNAIKIAIEGREWLKYSYEYGEESNKNNIDIRASRVIEIEHELVELRMLKALHK